jgi:hypothetical protein
MSVGPSAHTDNEQSVDLPELPQDTPRTVRSRVVPDVLPALAGTGTRPMPRLWTDETGFLDARSLSALLSPFIAATPNLHELRSDAAHRIRRRRRDLFCLPTAAVGSGRWYARQTADPAGAARAGPSDADGSSTSTLG